MYRFVLKKKFVVWFFIGIATVAALSIVSCDDEEDDVTGYTGSRPISDNPDDEDDTYDGITKATPHGSELLAAEDGPEESALDVPEINLNTFQLEITGSVQVQTYLNWNEILAYPATYTDTILMYCVDGWEVYGKWKGILVRDLLIDAGIFPQAEYIYFTCVDGYSTSLPVSYIMNYDIILAYEVNDSLLQKHDGFPLRLISYGKFGYKWAKWVKRVEALSFLQLGYWEMRGFSDEANVALKRRRYYEGSRARELEY